MTITINASFLPHTDAEASLAFYRDVLGFEVRLDVGYQNMRWITVGPPNQRDTAIVLHPSGVGDGLTAEESALLNQIVAKGGYFGIGLATDDLDATFAQLEARGADVVQEPIEQDYGVRDAAFRDPAGNLIRIQENKR
ncbi:MAG: VOC family protein [Propioniciclava sp.]|uniref:VOC family protein n=1 Tax=Propioniciclava sp. TaxID=2038686 RepID=UPI0039E44A25